MSPISTRSSGSGDNFPALRRIRSEVPALRMWIDNGAADTAALEALIGADLGAPVIGSESQRDGALIARHKDSTRVVLSLDFRGDAFQGPEEILAEPELWPRRIIVMTLARVGSGAGPDLERLAAIRSIAGGARNLCRRRRARRRRSLGAQSRGRRRRPDRDRAARRAGRQGRSGGDLKSVAVAAIRSSCRRGRTA